MKYNIKSRVLTFFKSGYILIFLLTLVVFTVLTKGMLIRPSNIINILIQSSVTGILTVGMTMVIIDRGIDLSVGGITSLTSAIGAILMVKWGLPWFIVVFIMLGVGSSIGFLNGISIAKIGIAPFISTLAMMKITQGLSLFILTGKTIYGFSDKYRVFGQGYFLFIPISVWILLILILNSHLLLKYTCFGRELYAMGGNPEAAWLTGIKVKRNRILVYMISGFVSGVAAIIVTSKIMCAQVTIGQGSELDAIAACVVGGVSLIGGKGTIIGAIFGTVIIVLINNGLNLMGVSPFIQTAVKGLIIFVAVTLDVVRNPS